MKKIVTIITFAIIVAGGVAYAFSSNPRYKEIKPFYEGHTHEGRSAIDFPQHSGGTDRYGCHNASVPYHCH